MRRERKREEEESQRSIKAMRNRIGMEQRPSVDGEGECRKEKKTRPWDGVEMERSYGSSEMGRNRTTSIYTRQQQKDQKILLLLL